MAPYASLYRASTSLHLQHYECDRALSVSCRMASRKGYLQKRFVSLPLFRFFSPLMTKSFLENKRIICGGTDRLSGPWVPFLPLEKKLSDCSGVLSSPIRLLCISPGLFKLLRNQDNLLFQDPYPVQNSSSSLTSCVTSGK